MGSSGIVSLGVGRPGIGSLGVGRSGIGRSDIGRSRIGRSGVVLSPREIGGRPKVAPCPHQTPNIFTAVLVGTNVALSEPTRRALKVR